ncbi:hypothetical protein BU15DRAFT_52686 [Melanogaster broomeanus]|nr:hypothetical protein BU15DRAFT_52686 [Melanogaster broomeanus]
MESMSLAHRNCGGYVDYENVYGIEGIGIANAIINAQDAKRKNMPKKSRSMITLGHGESRRDHPHLLSYFQSEKQQLVQVTPPTRDSEGKQISCDPSDATDCSLHLHSVTDPHNFGRIFSSPAPGLVMGVGSIGKQLAVYEECDTFLSTDAGLP